MRYLTLSPLRKLRLIYVCVCVHACVSVCVCVCVCVLGLISRPTLSLPPGIKSVHVCT